ncbi:MAG: LacI family transcriptional regulator [Micromonosporaceae bacterium]|jgi:LacI family transcriptional regulator|nr:LacI family transcriptional regulator [Micromonosporaceae bacterium]
MPTVRRVRPVVAAAAQPTLGDVARLAEVSVATASRVLSPGNREPRPALRVRVLAAAERLNYTPNANARAIARGGSDIVGLIVSDLSDPYFSTIAAGAIRVADEHGVLTTLADTRRDPRREIDYLSALRRQRARGVIVVGSRMRDEALHAAFARELAAYRSTDGRVSVISQPRLDADTIAVSNRAGARALAIELCRLGYRRFAVLAGPADLITATDRLAGFKAGLTKCGVELPRSHVIHGEFTRDGAYAAALRLLADGPAVDCIFAVNDVMAVGVIAAARQAGVKMPDDVGVAGFDDILTLRDVVPALTTVRIPLYDIGVEAMRRVLDLTTTPGVRRVAGSVVLRDSTARIPNVGSF